MALDTQARQLVEYRDYELPISSSQVSIGASDRRNRDRHVAAWLRDRNVHNVKANWCFRAADARIKLKSLYPAL